MRIYGPNGTTLGSPAGNTKRTSSSGFSLPDAAAAPEETRAASAPRAAVGAGSRRASPQFFQPSTKRVRASPAPGFVRMPS